MGYKAVIFDLDGVICSTDRYHYQAWKEIADQEQIYFDEQINHRLRGVGRRDSLEIILERSKRPYTEEEKEALAEKKNESYKKLLEGMTPADLPREVKDTLDALRKQGIKVAIGSSSKNAKLILKQIGLERYFDFISDGTMIQHSKPHPEVFLKAAEGLGLSPEDCLVVEDARAGIVAADRGGFESAGVGEASGYELTDYSLHSIADLLGVLERQNVSITNKSMELSECKKAWFFDEKYRCWCLEDILYTDKATTPKFQRLSIFVPEPYMKENGEIVSGGMMNGYTPKTVPVIFENNSAGYMQMPHVWLDGPRCYAQQYLKRGFVYVTCGNRGSESKDAEGGWCGKSPANLVDLKTAIRFLRHNADCIPGNLNRIISVGWSAGGAMSTLLGVTGNHRDYLPYLEENGAFMEERDDVYASQIYCPIVDLEHADLAYEWMFHADRENEASPAGPAGVMTPFQEALSAKLKERYVAYFNSLGLVDPKDHTPLLLREDGRGGSAYEYLMKTLEESASVYLRKLAEGELEDAWSPEEYLSGDYEYETMAPVDGGRPDDDGAELMQGHAGPGVALRKPLPDGTASGQEGKGQTKEKPSLGELVSRPPKGVPYQAFTPPMITVPGKDKREWLTWDKRQAHIADLDTYVLKHRRRMKPCTSFDTLGMDSGENRVFGTLQTHYMHFNPIIADVIQELREDFPEEYQKYYAPYAEAQKDPELARRVYLVNPLNYIGTAGDSDDAEYFRIRVGAGDADTSLSVSMTLALKLMMAGKPVDYALVWDKPHCEADYPGEVCDWIESICKPRVI